jgi:hypothetical protein
MLFKYYWAFYFVLFLLVLGFELGLCLLGRYFTTWATFPALFYFFRSFLGAFFYFGLVFVFRSTGVWAQGIMVARQALYQLSHSTSPQGLVFLPLAGIRPWSFIPKASHVAGGAQWDLDNFLPELKPQSF